MEIHTPFLNISGLAFYDWETQELVRRIEIQPKHVYWSSENGGELVCISTEVSKPIIIWEQLHRSGYFILPATRLIWIFHNVSSYFQESYFILKYSSEAVAEAKERGDEISEDGVEEAFDVSAK